MQYMNRDVLYYNTPRELIAKAIWEGTAIMGTDGSVRDPIATYSFVISLSQEAVAVSVKGGGFLPPTAQYLDPYSNQTEAATLLAGINPSDTSTPALPIAIDNKSVVLDVYRVITPLDNKSVVLDVH
jgi:hypothetical protein